MKKKKKTRDEEFISQAGEDDMNVEKSGEAGDNENIADTSDNNKQKNVVKESSWEEKRSPVEALEEELKSQKDKYIRLMAEFDNYKRRTGKEYERIVESANERLMLDIIEVRENFNRALKMAEKSKDYSTFLEGMKLIFNNLDDNLTKNGLVVFTEVGDEFDPEIHDAMMKTPHNKIPEDHIVEIYEKGYKLKNHVIKHAKVIVSSGKPEKSEESEDKKEDKKEKSEEMLAD